MVFKSEHMAIAAALSASVMAGLMFLVTIMGFGMGGPLVGFPLLLLTAGTATIAIRSARVEIRVEGEMLAARNVLRTYRIPMSDIVEFGVAANSALGVNSGVSAHLRDGKVVVFDGVRSLNIGEGSTRAEEVAAELNLLIKHVEE